MDRKLVMVTGASSGIGRACALRFAKEGWNVIITGRNEMRLSTLEQTLKEYGVEVKTLVFDVRDADAAQKALDSLEGAWAVPDVLINNAGLALGRDPICEADPEDWNTMIDTNIKGLLNITRMVVPYMVKRNSGQIINIGSVAGEAAYKGGSVYCATKAAVRFISDALRIELMETPIRVTNIKPGLVETNFSVIRFHGDTEKAKHVYEGVRPLTGEDVADAVWYAASVPGHVQISEMTILATHQPNGTMISKDPDRVENLS